MAAFAPQAYVCVRKQLTGRSRVYATPGAKANRDRLTLLSRSNREGRPDIPVASVVVIAAADLVRAAA